MLILPLVSNIFKVVVMKAVKVVVRSNPTLWTLNSLQVCSFGLNFSEGKSAGFSLLLSINKDSSAIEPLP